MSDELNVAIEAAKEGGKHALKYFDKGLKVEFKDDNTPITKADKESEEVVKKYILKHFPTAKFVAEESGGSTNEKEFWTIDPIDGTRSFSRGIPTWGITISFYKESSFKVGVCYLPVFNQILYAQKGKGAFLDGKRVHVSKINSFSKALFGFGNPRYIKNKNSLMSLILSSAAARSWEVNYSCFLLAQGKVDATLDGYAHLWDFAPFKVIIEEAGGKVTALDGSPITVKTMACITTNGLLHDEVVKIFNQ